VSGEDRNVAKGGRTVLFVSHNMAAVQGLCTSGVFLSQGRVVTQGTAADVVQHYLKTIAPPAIESSSLGERTDRSGNGASGLRVSGWRTKPASQLSDV